MSTTNRGKFNQSPHLKTFAEKFREINKKASTITVDDKARMDATKKNGMNIDMIEEIEKFHEQLIATPLFLNKQKQYLTVTKKVPYVAIIDRKSYSTFSNKNDHNLKPTLNAT